MNITFDNRLDQNSLPRKRNYKKLIKEPDTNIHFQNKWNNMEMFLPNIGIIIESDDIFYKKDSVQKKNMDFLIVVMTNEIIK